MDILQIIIVAFSGLLIAGTLLPLLPIDHWTVRAWEFPRLQLAVVLFAVIVAVAVVYPYAEVWHYILIAVLLGCLVYQLFKIAPYTPVFFKQVRKSSAPDAARSIAMISSNVYAENKNVEGLIDLVNDKDPDLVLTLETNHWWEQKLEQLEDRYPFTVKVPLENMYGMHLYSRLALEHVEVKYLIDPEIPSIHGNVVLRSGERVEIHCLHPMPPSPTESETSTDRDAELLLVGKFIDTKRGPVIVLGDLNDVAWSYTTSLFQKVSGLLDPRKGRGFFNTFNAKYPIFRWPLDHIFHSNHFTLNNIERLPSIGSDHFPMYISLHLEPIKVKEQEEPMADQEEEQQALEKIAEAKA